MTPFELLALAIGFCFGILLGVVATAVHMRTPRIHTADIASLKRWVREAERKKAAERGRRT